MLVNQVDPCNLYRSEAVIDQTLTLDAFKVMLNYLDTVAEINDAKSVSKYWYSATLSLVKDKFKGIDAKEISLSDSFMGLQAAIFKTRDKIVEMLKLLSDDELDKQECEPYRFFEHTINLTKVCKAIDKANTISDLGKKGGVLHECVDKLAHMLMMEKALDVTRKIEDIFWKQMSFANISSIFVDNGNIAKAIEIQLTEMIQGDVNTDEAIRRAAVKMSRSGQIMQARMHAENIQCPDLKTNWLELIEVMDLCKKAKFKEAEALADTYWASKSDAYVEISFELHHVGQWEECLRIADAIPMLQDREHCLNFLMCMNEEDESRAAQVIELLDKNNVTLELDNDF